LQDITPQQQIDSKPYKGDDETYFKESEAICKRVYEKDSMGYRQFKV
jgi:hypothetical protein